MTALSFKWRRETVIVVRVPKTTHNLSNLIFHVVVFKRTAKNCTKVYNARAQPLFYSLNLLFGVVLVSVAVVISLSSLICFEETLNISRVSNP